MKKIIAITLTIIMCFSAMSAFAYRNGDVIGNACYTDIRSRINGYDIASYNVDGYTYIIAEDLRNYGFDVVWDPYARTLSVGKVFEDVYSDEEPTYKTPFIPDEKVGEKSFELLYTDIETYVDGRKVKSFNINGRTIFRFEELACFGDVVWNEKLKTIELDVSYFHEKRIDLKRASDQNTFLSKARQIEIDFDVYLQTAMTQMELNEGSAEIYRKWDDLLNEVYAYLRDTMPANEFELLKADERKWVSEKEVAVEEGYKMFEGGSMAPMNANCVGIGLTEARCYYLISLIDIYK